MAKREKPPRSWDIDMLFVLGKREGIKAKHLRAIPVLILESWLQGGKEEGKANYIWTKDIAKRLVDSGLVPPFKPKGTSVILASLTTIQASRNLIDPPLIEYQGEGYFWVNLPHYEWLLQEYRPKYRELYPEDYEKLFKAGEPDWAISGKTSSLQRSASSYHVKSGDKKENRSSLASAQRYKSHCEHCGNTTFKSRIGSPHKAYNSEQEYVEYTLYSCEICEHVILLRESAQLWPSSVTFPPEVPERIRTIYEEAKYVKSKSPSSFVVQIRRGLEVVAKDKNAKGKDLFAKIDWLIQHEGLPQVFGQMSHISRLFGNLGAHDTERDVKPSDADIVDEFFRAIIEYIYIAPAKVNLIKILMGQK